MVDLTNFFNNIQKNDNSDNIFDSSLENIMIKDSIFDKTLNEVRVPFIFSYKKYGNLGKLRFLENNIRKIELDDREKALNFLKSTDYYSQFIGFNEDIFNKYEGDMYLSKVKKHIKDVKEEHVFEKNEMSQIFNSYSYKGLEEYNFNKLIAKYLDSSNVLKQFTIVKDYLNLDFLSERFYYFDWHSPLERSFVNNLSLNFQDIIRLGSPIEIALSILFENDFIEEKDNSKEMMQVKYSHSFPIHTLGKMLNYEFNELTSNFDKMYDTIDFNAIKISQYSSSLVVPRFLYITK